MIPDDVQSPPAVALLTRKDPHALPEKLLLHIACQTGGQILVDLPAYYLCGAPVRLLLGRIAPGDGPDGPGVCQICAALDHPGRRPGQDRPRGQVAEVLPG